MYEQDLDLMDEDDASEISASSADMAGLSASAAATAHSSKAKSATAMQNSARVRLEAVREERALRKAIYDDLYFMDSDD
jgi:hypothetical protein